MRLIVALAALATLAGCNGPDMSNYTPDQRIAILGIMMNRPQTPAWHGEAYQIPVQSYRQPRYCYAVGTTMECN